jgi:putative oxidoreductase
MASMHTQPLATPSFARPFLRTADRLAWLGPLALRLVVGISFALTGWGKLHNLDAITRFFDSLGIPAASIQAPMVAGIEFVGGLLVVLGLGTRVAAGLLAGVMGVALLTAIAPGADGPGAIVGSIEAMYLAVFVYLAASGGGAASLDHRLWRRAE